MDKIREPGHPDRADWRDEFSLAFNRAKDGVSLDRRNPGRLVVMLEEMRERILALEARVAQLEAR